METNEGAKKKLKMVIVLTMTVGMTGLYVLKGISFNVTATYPNATRPASPGRTSISKRNMTNMERMKAIGESLLDINFKSSDNTTLAYNIMVLKTIRFDPAYKNPCWKGTKANGPLADRRLHCLPYFYIIGVKKSGTTDVYSRIQHHPEVCYPGFKESQWMARLRFGLGTALLRRPQIHELLRKGPDVKSLSFYVSMFDLATKCIQSQSVSNKEPSYSFITGDATPSLLHLHTNWEMFPGNEGLDEPKYTNFHYIKHLTPQAKIIMLFREPVSRLYSDFHHIMKRAKMENAPKLFHSHVTKLVKTYEDCFMAYTERQCIYNDTLQQTLIQAMEKILEERVQNSGQARKNHYGDMLAKTNSLLKQFYKPYNEEMARLMGDTRYLFEEA